jgi:hypothetical protein
MDDKNQKGGQNEQKLVKLYMELTGTSESSSRSVLMYVGSAATETAETPEPARPPAP